MASATGTKHEIVHFELSSSDPAASSKFYGDLFGWSMYHMAEFDYHTFNIGNGTGGGFNKINEPGDEQGELPYQTKQGDVIVYISTDDIDATLARAQELGGHTVTPKMEIPGQGWMALFEDPSGNRVGLWQSMRGES